MDTVQHEKEEGKGEGLLAGTALSRLWAVHGEREELARAG